MRQDPNPSYVCTRQGLREEGALAQHVHQGALGTGERVVLRTGLSEKNLPITALRAHLLSGQTDSTAVSPTPVGCREKLNTSDCDL